VADESVLKAFLDRESFADVEEEGHFERISEHTRHIRMVSLSCGFVRVWLDVRVD
jgi:hypothetical protein